MKLSVLVDNNTFIDRYYLGEPAVAFHLETGQKRVLFDTGYSGAFLRNAGALGIDLLRVDVIALSHGHIDHTGGLEAYVKLLAQQPSETRSRPTLIAHPTALQPKRLDDGKSIGISVSIPVLQSAFEMQTSPAPVWIDERLVFLGQIERTTSFEQPAPVGFSIDQSGCATPDTLPDDTALAYITDEGIVVITGCSHSGICNIVETARRVTGVDRVIDIVGGFHLQNPPPMQLAGTARFIAALGLRALHASHCTDLHSKIALAASAPLHEVGSGLQLEY